MYKDKDKQREANRQANKRYRQGITQKVSREQGITDIEAMDLPPSVTHDLSHGMVLKIKPTPERTAQGNIRVSKPGDPDYEPQCETTRAFVEDRAKLHPMRGMKRGKDIKCFTDLPLDVQQTIDRMSTTDGRIDQDVKAKRITAAINYQHLFPDRYHSTGVTHA